MLKLVDDYRPFSLLFVAGNGNWDIVFGDAVSLPRQHEISTVQDHGLLLYYLLQQVFSIRLLHLEPAFATVRQ